MNDADELAKLADLHARGVLNDEEFAKAKARVLDGQARASAGAAAGPNMGAVNGLRRARMDRWLGGVCGGIARITGVESWIWRLMFALLALFAGTGVVVYVLMWLLIPADPLLPGRAPFYIGIESEGGDGCQIEPTAHPDQEHPDGDRTEVLDDPDAAGDGQDRRHRVERHLERARARGFPQAQHQHGRGPGRWCAPTCASTGPRASTSSVSAPTQRGARV